MVHRRMIAGRISTTELGKLIGCRGPNINYLIKRATVDLLTAYKFSVALKYNFLKHYNMPWEPAVDQSLANIGEAKSDWQTNLEKIHGLTQQLDLLQRENENLKLENGYLKQINELLSKKK